MYVCWKTNQLFLLIINSRYQGKTGKMGKLLLSLMIIKRLISDTNHGTVPSCDTALEFRDAVVKKFKESDKAKIGDLMRFLI